MPEGRISFSMTREIGSKKVVRIDMGNKMDEACCGEGGMVLLVENEAKGLRNAGREGTMGDG